MQSNPKNRIVTQSIPKRIIFHMHKFAFENIRYIKTVANCDGSIS